MRIAIIGGTGFEKTNIFKYDSEVEIDTPFGKVNLI